MKVNSKPTFYQIINLEKEFTTELLDSHIDIKLEGNKGVFSKHDPYFVVNLK